MFEGRTYFNVAVQLGTDDATLTVIATPTAGGASDNFKPALRIHRIVYHPNTATAQTWTLDVGSKNLMNLPTWAFLRRDSEWMEGGILCPEETALICSPSAAGNAGDFFVTYSIEG